MKQETHAADNRLVKLVLPVTVFLTGACVLVIEVAAMRILSPYFGNTLYATSSVLGVILGALSLGYYLGGRLADKRPSRNLFYAIILSGGLLTFALQFFSLVFLPFIGYDLPITTGPLISSLFMFLLPGVALGMLSPFAIKLQSLRFPESGTGTIAGEVFFWSTLGSIAGSLLTGFVLVPLFGLNATILGTAIFLSLLGGVPLVSRRLLRHNKLLLLLFAAVAMATSNSLLIASARENAIYTKDGIYERIKIFDDTDEPYSLGQPARFMLQDRSNSSAMYLDSDELAFPYTRYYALYKGIKPDASRSLVLGGAAYSIPKALLADSPAMKVDIAEIEPSLYELAQQYFRLQPSPRLNNQIIDGRRLLATTDKRYDVIFSDVYYSLYSIPAHFTTREFMQLTRDRLQPGGVFIANLIGSVEQTTPSFILSEIKTIQSVYPQVHVFAVGSPEQKSAQNIILVGVNSKTPVDFGSPVFKDSPLAEMQTLQQHQLDLSGIDLSSHTILTDNYAPVEYYMSKVLAE
ncbi:fused MFS/spermidine synthase [Candidatus Saccharibacteria bacterium]|nr:fused MFS/spermidine synthase [Candidatus Saccharibacteria bacterium]